jgi:RimJ/RimL family protein N-acetyltransferase
MIQAEKQKAKVFLMVYDDILYGDKVSLRALELEDCIDDYINWLNDKIVNEYLEIRWEKQTYETVLKFVYEISKSDHSYIFAIIENITNEHIGNIKLGPIHKRYKYADISYFIGNRSAWGKGYATEAIKLIVDFGFDVLSLHRLQAGIISGNDSSAKVLERNGFIKEGILKEKFLVDEAYRDHIVYGLINKRG